MGICQVPVPVSQRAVLFIYRYDDDAVSGDDAFGLSGDPADAAYEYDGGGHPSGDFFHPSGVYHLPVFQGDTGGAAGGGAD